MVSVSRVPAVPRVLILRLMVVVGVLGQDLTLLQKTDEASAAPRGVVAVAFKGQDLEALAQSWHAGGAAPSAALMPSCFLIKKCL